MQQLDEIMPRLFNLDGCYIRRFFSTVNSISIAVCKSMMHKLCTLTVFGVDEAGQSHLLAIEDVFRESTQSWRKALLKLQIRAMNAPESGIGDEALEFWAAAD